MALAAPPGGIGGDAYRPYPTASCGGSSVELGHLKLTTQWKDHASTANISSQMSDILSKAQRSVRMSRIRGADTKPELIVRKEIWRSGFRYRLHDRNLPGKPDIVLKGLRVVIFVHGCFWHAHSCQRGRIPDGNSAFWAEKFSSNKSRDRRNRARLARAGWKIVTVWECALATRAKRERALAKLVLTLKQQVTEANCE